MKTDPKPKIKPISHKGRAGKSITLPKPNENRIIKKGIYWSLD